MDVFQTVYQDIIDDKANLPSLPDIAIRVRQAVHDPNSTVSTISKILKADIPLAAHLVSVANSPFYRRGKNVDSLSVAIGRLGINTTRDIAMSHMLKSVYCSHSKILKKLLRNVWSRSIRIAAFSYVLGNRCNGFNPEQAMLAGLLQDIGVLPLLIQAEQHPEIVNEPKQLAKLIHKYAGEIGTALLSHWQFDDVFIDVASARNDWMRDKGPEADLADLVLIARLHALMGTPAIKSVPKLCDIPAFTKLPLGELTPNMSLSMLDEAKDEINEIQTLLKGSP